LQQNSILDGNRRRNPGYYATGGNNNGRQNMSNQIRAGRYYSSANQKFNNITCANCDESGHIYDNCRYQDRPIDAQGHKIGPKILLNQDLLYTQRSIHNQNIVLNHNQPEN